MSHDRKVCRILYQDGQAEPLEIRLHADGRIEGDAARLAVAFERLHVMSQVQCWLILRELQRQQAEAKGGDAQ